MGLRPRNVVKNRAATLTGQMVGRTPRSAADAPVGLLAPRKMPMSLCRLRDEGVPRGPGGPPHHAGGFSPLSQSLPHGERRCCGRKAACQGVTQSPVETLGLVEEGPVTIRASA
jgi:hypothetical protein